MAATFAQSNALKFIKPIKIGGVTSPFGMRGGKLHAGVDWGAPLGTPVVASESGKVVRSEWFGGYGNAVDISHGQGYLTRYAHLSVRRARTGQEVAKGDIIGLVGSTGDSSGPHLHFEIRVNGSPRNPLPLLGKNTLIPAGVTNPLNPGSWIPDEFKDFAKMLTDTSTWQRLGLILLGFILIGIGLFAVWKDVK